MDDDQYYFLLRPKALGSLDLDSDEPDNEYLRSYSLKLMAYRIDDDEDDEIEVGHLDATIFLAGQALNDRYDIVDAADARTQESYEAAHALFSDDGILRWLQLNAEVDDYDGLWLERIWLDPAYRRNGLGARFLARAIHWLNPAGLCAIVLQPCSEVFFRKKASKVEGEPGPDENDPYYKRAFTKEGQKRLEEWYESLGFARWKNTTFWWQNLYNYKGVLPVARLEDEDE